jgi:hypothetical protein
MRTYTDLHDRLKARVGSCSSLILKRTSSIMGPQLQRGRSKAHVPYKCNFNTLKTTGNDLKVVPPPLVSPEYL